MKWVYYRPLKSFLEQLSEKAMPEYRACLDSLLEANYRGFRGILKCLG